MIVCHVRELFSPKNQFKPFVLLFFDAKLPSATCLCIFLFSLQFDYFSLLYFVHHGCWFGLSPCIWVLKLMIIKHFVLQTIFIVNAFEADVSCIVTASILKRWRRFLCDNLLYVDCVKCVFDIKKIQYVLCKLDAFQRREKYSAEVSAFEMLWRLKKVSQYVWYELLNSIFLNVGSNSDLNESDVEINRRTIVRYAKYFWFMDGAIGAQKIEIVKKINNFNWRINPSNSWIPKISDLFFFIVL